MNDKKTLITIIVAIFLLLGLIGYVYASTAPQDDKATITEQCTISNPTGCEQVIEQLQKEYEKLQEQQKVLNKKANVYRAINDLNSTGSVEVVDEKLN